ncbi:putative short-chain dehydrogenase [Auricularia subglabra TFB-10046 SS5]|nr:putative short-chain dehydrogenase [Auricularia subglabra TFB-10046 SS5]
MSAYNFIHEQLWEKPPVPTTDFTGKTIIVTGANVGLGKEATRHYARLGAAHVVMAVRSLEKGEAARTDILADPALAGCRATLSVWKLDMASYASVQAFAERASSELERLDIAMLNAGVAAFSFELYELDESTITVNVVSTMLLAALLVPTLRRSALEHHIEPVMSIVGSGIHLYASFPERHAENIFAAMSDPAHADMDGRYTLSKLVQLLAVREFADLVNGGGKPFVIVNTLNPGLCTTELVRGAKGLFKLGTQISKALLAWTAEEGSRTLVHASTAGKESHGAYLSAAKIKPEGVSAFVTSDEGRRAQKKLWAELSAKLEYIHPGIISAI